ncbi:hypothetical protein SO802_027907 [Lithocarpus litseifolius]|uniref:Uncharacterized protein n=1 Tax=Lithocarpus litseifolius TaxID=425828 RepID=A0AAW2BPU7_9ROSI
MFLDLARMIVSYHRRKRFAGDLPGQVRIHLNPGGQLLAELPYEPIQSNDAQMLREGIMCDVSHFRRMVALLFMICFPTANVDALLSMLFNLFFSPIFTVDSCCYSAFQFFHSIFYSAKERVKFIHTFWKTMYRQKSQSSIPILYLKGRKSMVFENGGREIIIGHFIRDLDIIAMQLRFNTCTCGIQDIVQRCWMQSSEASTVDGLVCQRPLNII